jgi:hypothetical protein
MVPTHFNSPLCSETASNSEPSGTIGEEIILCDAFPKENEWYHHHMNEWHSFKRYMLSLGISASSVLIVF